jgi:hypothetical protein
MRKWLGCVLLGALCGLTPVRGADSGETHYTILLAGNHAGTATSRQVGANDWVYSYEFNDRGRGPQITEKVTVDEHGVPQRIESTGHDYWKTPVNEFFQHSDGKASWTNAAEKVERSASRRSFFISLNGTPQEFELLARALLSNRNRLDLLPDGEATIEKVADAEAQGNGFQRPIHLYAIVGLDFNPIYLWLDERRAFFAQTSGWSSTVLTGFEASVPALEKRQNEVVVERGRLVAKRLAHRPSGALVVRGARLFDPATGQVRPNMTVVVSGDHITRVEPDGKYELPDGAEVIAARGRMLLPGLFDMHVHLSDQDGILNIAAGVTSVRDMANDIDHLNELRKSWESLDTIGPRVFMAGFVDSPGPYAGPSKVLVSTVPEAIAAVDRYKQLGYVQMKLYSSLDLSLVDPIIARAHQLGMRVSGHIPNGLTAAQAVLKGFNEIQHANFLFLNFIPNVDTRTPARFTAVGEHAAEIDLRSPEVRAFIALLKEHQVAVDPTLNVFEGLFTGRPGEIDPSLAAVADRLPTQVRRALLGGALQAPAGMADRYRQSFKAMLALVKALDDAGITIEAGTDALVGFTLHRELELYNEAGIPAAKVLRLATLGAAHVLGKDNELGSIEPNKKADFILVDGDPVTHISDIRRVMLTVKDGVVFDPAELYKTIGVKPVS